MIAYADILIPLPLSNPVFTYIIEGEETKDWDLLKGRMIEVPFGRGKSYTGVIVSVSDRPRSSESIVYKKARKILPYPPIPNDILRLWQWAAEYYMCSLGDIFVAAVPSSFRPEGKQEKELPKAAHTIKGWVASKKFVLNSTLQSALFVEMKRKPMVTKAMTVLLEKHETLKKQPHNLTELQAFLGVGTSIVRQLKNTGIIEEHAFMVSDDQPYVKADSDLTDDPVSQKIRFGSHNILLLHIENSSIIERIPFAYIRNILLEGKQILLLVPDADSLNSIRPILDAYFQDAVSYYYHEGTSVKERQHTWLSALEGKSGIYVGLRVASWLPFSNLGLSIVVDEGDRGYRQYEPAPRYTATHIALMLSTIKKSKCILISPCPSIECYMQAIQKKYAFVKISLQPKSIEPIIVSLPKAFEEQRVQGRLLSFQMMGAIREALDEGGRVLLLYQRKGYAKRATCTACGESPKCPKCHTIYRYFHENHRLVCGMCGHYEALPSECPTCGKKALFLEGTGIERIKSAITRLYPGVIICMAEELERTKEKAQIILSTSYDPPQSLLKDVTTIGILQFDLLSTFPDFRANEYSHRFLLKCRNESPSLQRMVIQVLTEDQNAINAFVKRDYRILLDHELEERHIVLFPPFSRHIDIYFESKSQTEAFKLATQARDILTAQLSDCSVMGPAPLPLHKKDREIGYKLTLLSPLNRSSQNLRNILESLIGSMIEGYRGPHMYVYYDVDPL